MMRQALVYLAFLALCPGLLAGCNSLNLRKTGYRKAENCMAVIIDGGKSNWVIVNRSRNIPPAQFATEELAKYLNQMTGKQLESADDANGKPAIVVGLRTDLSAEEQSALAASAKGHDGYSISVEPNRIVVAGDNARGVLYGVYALLERAGCRWYYPSLDPKDPEVVPQLKTLQLKEDAWSVASPMRFRMFCTAADYGDFAAMLDWGTKCRYNMFPYDRVYDQNFQDEAKKRNLMTYWGLHAFGHFMPMEKYFKDHPEWFGLQNGKRVAQFFGGSQFCWSNPEAQKAFVETAIEVIQSKPGIDLLPLCGLDGVASCECDECKKLNPSDWQTNLLNKLIERLAEVAPHITVEGAGAYFPVDDPPLKIKPDPRLRLHYADWGRDHAFAYDNPRYHRKATLDKWMDTFEGRATVFQYYSDQFAEPWVVAPYATAIKGDRAYLLGRGSDGMLNLNYPQGYWWNAALNTYLAGICFYDASTDPFDLIQEYALVYYGEKAGPLMAKYFDLWAQHTEIAYHARSGANDQDRATLAQQRKDLVDPAVEAAKGDKVLAHRVGKVEKLHRSAEMLMELQRTIDEVRKARETKQADEIQRKADAATTCYEQTKAWLAGLVDTKEGLFDEQLVDFFIPRSLEEIKNLSAEQVQEKKEFTPQDMVPESYRKE